MMIEREGKGTEMSASIENIISFPFYFVLEIQTMITGIWINVIKTLESRN